jgi:metal-dependent HD superfamily phosphatase/phosphodiesterase
MARRAGKNEAPLMHDIGMSAHRGKHRTEGNAAALP